MILALSVAAAMPHAASAAVVRVTDLNAAEIRALDRAKPVVILPDGVVEEHWPYLPAYTDGILSERLTKNPLFQTWIRAADERDRQLEAKERAWTERVRR